MKNNRKKTVILNIGISGSDPDGDQIVSYKWDWGDGIPPTF